MKFFKTTLLALVLTGSITTSTGLNARQWDPTPIEAAREYLKIEHKLKNGQTIVLFWISPEYLEARTTSRMVQVALQDHVMIAIMHFSFDNTGQLVPQPHSEIEVEAGSLGAISTVSVNDLPPELASFSESFRHIVTGGDPTMGQAVNIQFYDGSRVNNCVEDVLYVKYLDEKYDFKTPLPGCE